MCPDGAPVALCDFGDDKIVVRPAQLLHFLVHPVENAHAPAALGHTDLAHRKPARVVAQRLPFPRERVKQVKHRLQNRDLGSEGAWHYQCVAHHLVAVFGDDARRDLIERSYDEDKGKKYYKVWFDSEE